MSKKDFNLLYPLLALMLSAVTFNAGAQAQTEETPASTADHTKFEELQQTFTSGPEVTKACLKCHTEASKQLHKSLHWTWEFDHEKTGQRLGKKYVVNSFCGSVTANYARCTSCHIGYGWKDGSFDFSSEENVDCLVCHDTTGTYKKFPTGAGHPAYEDKLFAGKKLFKAVDLANVAQNVGKTSRTTCGACHFTGGGGDAVKHGDIDSSLGKPDKQLDVHMDAQGLDYPCATCHTFINHQAAGSRYAATAKDTTGVAVPGRKETRATCESCHGTEPHPRHVNNKLNEHVDKVACQTCHIPAFARGGKATKTWWDWSTAGRLGPNAKPQVKKNEKGEVIYNTKKGDFLWEENVEPEYFWFDGTVRYSLVGDELDPSGVAEINQIQGSYEDPNARIWPFKIMRGKQPYDTVNNSFLVSHLFGKDDAAFWKSFDWDKALRAGMAEAKEVGQTDMDYSGSFDFIETRMYWPIAHMVAPKEDALACDSCHSQDGRLADLTGFYMPGRDANPWIDRIGWLLVAATLAGVLLHGLMRLVFRRRRKA
ncbi:MAG: tetrathionate reductase family octaheme c-type cytochrome [Pseudomonadota bacterium]|nr:tetrathionate reductase family octaheme c-type cytochrome [Pseudomonadota bacterium]